MHPEIENLINMALADGEVTDKERGIILRKAESLGLDKDEVEMILDGRIVLHNKQTNITTKHVELLGIVDIEYYPFSEFRNGYTKNDIDDDIKVFENFIVNELKTEIEKIEFKLDDCDNSPDVDDTCLVRFFVRLPFVLDDLIENNKTKLEQFSECPWTDERNDSVNVEMIEYQKLFIKELSINKSISDWHRTKDTLIRLSEGFFL